MGVWATGRPTDRPADRPTGRPTDRPAAVAVADLARDAGAIDPDALAQQLVMLYDGASVSAQMDHNYAAARTARPIAETLLDAATAGLAP